MRDLEIDARLRKAIWGLKKRAGDSEKMLREFRITEDRIEVGEPLTQLRGLLTGTPKWVEDRDDRSPNGR